MFHRSPQALDEDVAPPAAFAIHADLDGVSFENVGEFGTGELAALVGVEDLRSAVAGDGLFQCLDTEVRAQRIGVPLGEYPAAVPAHDRDQINKSPSHRDVGEIRGPHVIGTTDAHVPQQIGIDRMRRVPPAEVGLAVACFESHLAN